MYFRWVDRVSSIVLVGSTFFRTGIFVLFGPTISIFDWMALNIIFFVHSAGAGERGVISFAHFVSIYSGTSHNGLNLA